MHAEQLAVLRIEDQLDESFGLTGGEGAAAGAEGELADADLAELLARFFLGQTHAGDLRVRVSAAGDEAVIDRVVSDAEDALDAVDGLVVRDVGEVGMAVAGHRTFRRPVQCDAIADGPDVFQVGLVVGRDLDALAVHFQADFRIDQARRIGGDAGSDEQDVGFDRSP